MQRLNFSLIPRKGDVVKIVDYQQGPGENTGGREGKRRMEAGKERKMNWDKFKGKVRDRETRGGRGCGKE